MRWSILPFLLPMMAHGQALQPTLLTALPQPLDEVSGMIMVNDRVWVVLDSFNPSVLHQVDRNTGAITRSVTITGATNADWEEITTDDQYVYIGDIGNNYGMRTDLRILRFPIAVLLDETSTTTTVGTIAYAYADQTDFTPAVDGSNWDCEAMVVVDDSIFLFTKNWLDQRTHLYVLPAEPGTHLAHRRDTLDAQGLITGAALNAAGNSIALIGHTLGAEPFLWQLAGYTGHDLFGGGAQRRMLDMSAAQTEGIVWSASDTVLICNERGTTDPAQLWKLHLDLFSGVPEQGPKRAVLFHPDPASDHITVHTTSARCEVRIFDLNGGLMLRTTAHDGADIPLHTLPPGSYVYEQRTSDRTDRSPLVIVH